jgi:hypothetical protein
MEIKTRQIKTCLTPASTPTGVNAVLIFYSELTPSGYAFRWQEDKWQK